MSSDTDGAARLVKYNIEAKEKSSAVSEGTRTRAAVIESSAVGQFFDFNPIEGVITSRVSKSRVFLLNSGIWTDVEDEIIDVFSAAGYVIIHKIGHAYGTSFAKKIRSQSSSPTVSTLQSLASAAGWGKFEVTSDEVEGSWIKVIANECVFCDREKRDVHKDECSFLSGLIQGMAEELYDKNYIVYHNKCFNSGLHSCEVVLHESSFSTPADGGSWKSSMNPLR